MPPPPSPAAEPSPLAQPQPNVNHVHAVASDGHGTLLIATHHGVEVKTGSGAPVRAGNLSGDVLQVLVQNGLFFAAGHLVGVQVSHDGGGTWAPISQDVAGLDVHGFAIDPSRPGTIYAYAVGKGMLVSQDGGATWTHRPGYADSHYLTGMVVTADGTLLAGSPESGIMASPDHGAAFTAVRGGTGVIYGLSASATDANVVLVATENGLFLTESGGKDWSVGVTAEAVTGVGIDPTNPKHFYAGGADGSLFSTDNAGQSWTGL